MSLHLLRTTPGGTTRFSSKFINNQATSATDTEFFTCEYDRMIYSMWKRTGSPIQYHVSQFNIQSGVTTYLGYVTHSQLGRDTLPGGWLCDGKYMYFTFNSTTRLTRVSLSDMSTVNHYDNDKIWTCWGRSVWYNDHTIAILDRRGLALFDTKTLTWDHIRYKGSDTSGRTAFYVDDKIIIDSGVGNISFYNRETQQFTSMNLPTSSYDCELCGGDGKVYVINKAYVFVFDIETMTWEQEYTPVQFKEFPRHCIYSEGLVYITICGSPRFWVYETETKHVAYKMLPWNMPSGDNQCILTPYHKYAFIQCYSFGHLNYEGLYKYNAGFKYLQYMIPCAEDVIDYHSKDPCLVTKPSYLSYEIVPDEIPFEPIAESLTIKAAAVNKNNYKAILNIKIK